MKILKIYPEKDHPKRFNYNVNFGVWDNIQGDRTGIENFNSNPNEYDIVFLPQIKRWDNHTNLLNKIKGSKAKKVLFDNDSYRRSFKDKIYEGIDYIFYRDLDKNKLRPIQQSSLFLWSVNTDLFTPVYGGNGIAFNCSIGEYPLRKAIATFVRHKKVGGGEYISNLQKSAAAIHADSPKVGAVAAKVLEFAACGTHIISNRTKNMNLYFPDELIVYFDSIPHLKRIIKDFKPDIAVQKRLREIVVEKHDDRIRAREVINILNSKL